MVLLYYQIGPTQFSESLMSLFVSCNDIVADIAERISFAEHGKLFQLEIRKKKRDILNEKRESGIAMKKREFTLLTPM